MGALTAALILAAKPFPQVDTLELNSVLDFLIFVNVVTGGLFMGIFQLVLFIITLGVISTQRPFSHGLVVAGLFCTVTEAFLSLSPELGSVFRLVLFFAVFIGGGAIVIFKR